VLWRYADAEDAGPDPEAQRRLQGDRLTVDTGRHRAVGIDLEPRR
jgi:hypothetical protein